MGAVPAALLVLATSGPVTGGVPAAALAPPPAQGDRGGPVEVTAHPDPLSLLQDEDPARAANKRLVFDMWRSIVNAGHIELADTMLEAGYIQHSPVLPTGREAFKAIFSVVKRRDIPQLVSPPLVTILAEGDLVVMALREELPAPGGAGSYTSTHFNLFRARKGRLAEHWHSIQDKPGPDVLPAEKGGPQRITGISGAEQLELLEADEPALAANKRLAFEAWRRMIVAGESDATRACLDPDYIEHDPNFGQGFAGFRNDPAACTPDAEAVTDVPLVGVVAQGDLVVLTSAREHPHPSRPGETYTTARFDMFRIAGGRIAEHWDGASKPGTPQLQYGN